MEREKKAAESEGRFKITKTDIDSETVQRMVHGSMVHGRHGTYIFFV